MFFRKKKKKEEPKARETVESFSVVTLEISSTSSLTELEAVRTGSGAEVSVYGKHWGSGERFLKGRAECGADEILALLNECDLIGWDGFAGEHPPGLLDGGTFALTATVNGGRRVSAGGSGINPGSIDRLADGLFSIVNEKGRMFEEPRGPAPELFPRRPERFRAGLYVRMSAFPAGREFADGTICDPAESAAAAAG